MNSKGWDITDPLTVAAIEAGRAPFAAPYQWGKEGMAIPNPAHPDEIVGHVVLATPATAEAAVECAAKAAPRRGALPVAERAQIINRVADLYECDAYEFFALAAREAGKIVADCVAEVREAVDFLRFYAVEAAKAERDSQAPRCDRLYFTMEFPTGDLYGPSGGCIGHWQCRCRKARRANAIDRTKGRSVDG